MHSCPYVHHEKDMIKAYGKTKKGTKRLYCKICKRTFAETNGTFLHRLKTDPNELLITFRYLIEGYALKDVRTKGTKLATYRAWFSLGKKHVDDFAELLKIYSNTDPIQTRKFFSANSIDEYYLKYQVEQFREIDQKLFEAILPNFT